MFQVKETTGGATVGIGPKPLEKEEEEEEEEEKVRYGTVGIEGMTWNRSKYIMDGL